MLVYASFVIRIINLCTGYIPFSVFDDMLL